LWGQVASGLSVPEVTEKKIFSDEEKMFIKKLQIIFQNFMIKSIREFGGMQKKKLYKVLL